MAIAAGYGVLQLAALGWLGGRSVRLSTVLLAIMVGLYGCGLAAIVLQILYTRAVAAISGASLSTVVSTASYTVDPFIEEFVKIAPLLFLALNRRTRFQWGLTDYVVLGAGLGAGFGLLEAILRYGHRASQSVATVNGWLVSTSLSPPYVPGAGSTLTSWLPAPVSQGFLLFNLTPETYTHLIWSAVAGLGIGISLRARGLTRMLGLLPILFAGAEHAATNYDIALGGHSVLGDVLAAPFVFADGLRWLYPLLCLGVAAYFDRRDLARTRAAAPALSAGALAQFAMLRLPWTPLIALRFIRLRRAWRYGQARAPESVAGPSYDGLVAIRDRIVRASTAAAWERTPTVPALARALTGRLRSFTFSWRVIVWLLLLLPAVAYLVLGDFPATSFLQKAFTSSFASVVLTVLLIGGLGWLAWQSLTVARGLPAALGEPYGDLALRGEFRLLSGVGALAAGVASLVLVASGTKLSQRAISNFHVLDALAGAIVAVLLLLSLAALIAMFPPGGLALALAEGGALAGGITISGTAIAQTAVVGALSGWLLAEASDGGSSSESSSSSSSESGSGTRNNASNFPAEDFEGTEYSLEEIGSMTYRHTGSGEMHIGGSAPRPTEAEITNTLRFGEASPLDGQNAVQYVRDGIRVIVNRTMPWQSTSYYIGG
jgi:hypothetical protein